MKRRDALTALSALAAGSALVPGAFLSGCQAEGDTVTYRLFTADEIDLLERMAGVILPATENSPGADAVGIGTFMDVYVADCFEAEEQTALREGLARFGQRCREEQGTSFQQLSPEAQRAFLVALDKEADTYQQQLQPGQPSHYFSMVKYLTVFGYFTSEPGARQALRYVPIPGRYEGVIPYEKGEKAWAI